MEGWNQKTTEEIIKENPLYFYRLYSSNVSFRFAWKNKLKGEKE